jgi:hypothetical protein
VSSASGSSRQSVLIKVEPGAGTAPIFIQPNNGGTYDIDITPCVTFDLEVKDDDSPSVSIRASSALPLGSTLTTQGSQRARFEWCPTENQVNQALTWSLTFEADDGEHPPTVHTYLAVFRRKQQDGCTGVPPTIQVLEPNQDATVLSTGGFNVVIRVTDDTEVRDAPVLYYSYVDPGPNSPELTQFEATAFTAEGDTWRAAIPPSPSASDTYDVWFLASATDNDDAAGTACDKRTDTALRHFLAQKDNSSAANCELCASSTSCASGLCSSSGKCVPDCEGACTCQESTTIEGNTALSCGGDNACDSGTNTSPSCSPDPWSNAQQVNALSMLGGDLTGSICGTDESDWYKFTSGLDTVLTWTLEDYDAVDLDLELVDETGSSLVLASTLSQTETVSTCVEAGSVTYARVHLYPQSTASGGTYKISASQTDGSCCQNDEFEPNNNVGDAVPALDVFTGTLCPLDKDHYSFDITSPSTIQVWAQAVSGQALRLTIHGPLPATTKMGSAYGETGSVSWLGVLNNPGTYVIAISSLIEASTGYGGEIILNSKIDCSVTKDCPIDSACYEEDGCLPSTCTSQLECPELHTCKPEIIGTMAEQTCLSWCSNDSACRTDIGETCKRLGGSTGACEIAGNKNAGQSCETHRDCAGNLGCYAWPGGYCAAMGCTSNADCPQGNICGKYADTNRCLVECGEPGQALCRYDEGYACYLKLGVDNQFYNACAFDEDIASI